jgi:hypothetical protein
VRVGMAAGERVVPSSEPARIHTKSQTGNFRPAFFGRFARLFHERARIANSAHVAHALVESCREASDVRR